MISEIEAALDLEPAPLTEETLEQGLHFLCSRDQDLAQIFTKLGSPPMWTREPGFPALTLIILEQQVSLASARAAYGRLLETVSPLTPTRFLKLDDVTLKTIGFSRQKTAYCRDLARAIVGRRINLNKLDTMDDTTARSELVKVKGIGPWTADIYLLMVLRRPDIWPKEDLALAVAVQRIKRLTSRPTPDELDVISTGWKPWRAVAARLLWHYYLCGRV